MGVMTKGPIHETTQQLARLESSYSGKESVVAVGVEPVNAESPESQCSEFALEMVTSTELNKKGSRNYVTRFLRNEVSVSQVADAACLSYLAFVDWTIYTSLFASSYWHLLNPYFLKFNIQYVITLSIGFVLVPTICFVPWLFKRLAPPDNRLVTYLVQYVLWAAALQINDDMRSILLALAVGCIFFRRFVSVSDVDHISIASGFLLHFIVRWNFSSISPFDEAEYATAPVIAFILLTASVTRLHNKSQTFSLLYPDNCQSNFPLRWVPLKSLVIRIVWGVCATLSCGGFLYILPLVFTSDASMVRWNGLSSYPHGLFLVLSLSLGFAAMLVCWMVASTTTYRYLLPYLYFVLWLCCLLGSTLTVCLRGSVGSFIGSCILAVGVLPIFSMSLAAFQNSIFRRNSADVIQSSLVASLQTLSVGMIIFCLVQLELGLFVGHHMPMGGSFFFNSIPKYWFTIFFISLLPAIILIGIQMILKSSDVTDSTTTGESTNADCAKSSNASDPEIQSPDDAKPSTNAPTLFTWQTAPSLTISELRRFRRGKGKPSYGVRMTLPFSFSLFHLIITFALLMPAIRWRTLRWRKKGSANRSIPFSVCTWNIQLGYSLYAPRDGIGYLTLTDIQKVLYPLNLHYIGLQETDAANLLHNNRDLLGYLSERLLMHDYYGAPAYFSSPGVSSLSAVPLTDFEYLHLPDHAVPLGRYLTKGKIKYLDSSTGHEVEITVLNTHCDSFSYGIRDAQFKTIMNVLENIQGPLVLLGDLNGYPDETETFWNNKDLPEEDTSRWRGPLQLVMFSDDPFDRSSLMPTAKTTAEKFSHIDHIYYRGLCLKDKQIPQTIGVSDHRPVVASFTVPASDGSCPEDTSSTAEA